MVSKLLILFCIVANTVYGEDTRIVGGQNVDIKQFPYQVSLRNYDQHFCGGSIITPRSVLTAAQCYESPVELMTVVVGATLLDGGGTVYKVRHFIAHEFWNKETLENDIGVVILDQPIEYNPAVQPIPLASYNIGDRQTLKASGWGLTKHSESSPPNNLQSLNVETIGFAECRSRHSGLLFYSQVCTLQSGQGLCTGDAGGPLVASGQLHGIASVVDSCALGKPDVSTRVYSHLAWIESNIQ